MAELTPSDSEGLIMGAFMGKSTHKVHAANSVDTLWVIPSYFELRLIQGSVETLHGGAEMPKIKSSRQTPSQTGRSGKLDAGC